MAIVLLCLGCQEASVPVPEENSNLQKFPNPDHKTVLMCQGKPWQLVDTTQWNVVYNNLDIFKFYIDQLSDIRTSKQEKQDFIKILKFKKIKIAVEMGGLLAGNAGMGSEAADVSFAQEIKKVLQLTKSNSEGGLTGTLDVLAMDGPLRRVMYGNKNGKSLSLMEAIEEFMDVILLWKEAYPDIKINYLVNFPNWGWKGEPAYYNLADAQGEMGYGDFYDVLPKVIAAAKQRRIEINALTVDTPYDYAKSLVSSNQNDKFRGIDWMQRIIELEAMVKAEGWKFNLIYNSKRGGDRVRGSNELFYTDVMSYLTEYQNKGGDPDGYWIQSWYDYPNTWLPEDGDFTMTNLTKKVLEKVKSK